MDQKTFTAFFHDALEKLKPTKALAIDVSKIADHKDLPAFYPLQAALVMRIKTWKILFIGVTGLLLTIILLQQRIIFHKLFQKMNEEIVIVPGSPEFFRVRPGQIPDESVFLFAEYIAANLGTFTHGNVKYHYSKIAEHMSPATKGSFESATQSRLKDWEERRVDQVFAYEPVTSFDLVNDPYGAKYIASVRGKRTQYVEGHIFSETSEVLLLEFRSRGNLTPDRPFIFELDKMDWLSPIEFEAIKVARNLEGKKGKI